MLALTMDFVIIMGLLVLLLPLVTFLHFGLDLVDSLLALLWVFCPHIQLGAVALGTLINVCPCGLFIHPGREAGRLDGQNIRLQEGHQ